MSKKNIVLVIKEYYNKEILESSIHVLNNDNFNIIIKSDMIILPTDIIEKVGLYIHGDSSSIKFEDTTHLAFDADIKSRIEKIINNFTWITGGDLNYLKMIETNVRSIKKFSKYPITVYTFNCDYDFGVGIDTKRIDVLEKDGNDEKKPNNLKNKKYGLYYAKFLASMDIINDGTYNKYCWIDGDSFVLENIDDVTTHINNLPNYPLFMTYKYTTIQNWRYVGKIKLTGNYGDELSDIFNITRPDDTSIVATGLYLFDNKSNDFFSECLSTYEELKKIDTTVYVDDNAYSEERVANIIMWKYGYEQYLPVSWVNYQDTNNIFNNNIKLSSALLKGFDVMYNIKTNKPLFIHGCQPHINKKDHIGLLNEYNNYITKTDKLMIVAHPDDETIFGGGELLSSSGWRVIVLTCGDNEKRRMEFSNAVFNMNVNEAIMMNFDDVLINGAISMESLVRLNRHIREKYWEKIVTHNPIGEYGHPQHKDTFDKISAFGTDKLYVFGKSKNKLPDDILNKKKEILKLYKSEQESIQQINNNLGDWYISSDPNTNYIDNETITKYDPLLRNKTPFTPCYDKKE